MPKSYFKLFYMTHTFDSEVSLHSWLLWPMVRSITYIHEVKSPRASTVGTTLNVGGQTVATLWVVKVKKILKGRRDSIPSPSRSHEYLNFYFNFSGITLLGFVNKLSRVKSLLTMSSNVLLLLLK